MFFCILFNYTILRDTKDVLVVTAPGSGAEVRFLALAGCSCKHAWAAPAPPHQPAHRAAMPCHGNVPARRRSQVIPFLKTWVNLPMAIGFTVLYAKLANVLEPEPLFYAIIIPFILFFASFAFGESGHRGRPRMPRRCALAARRGPIDGHSI